MKLESQVTSLEISKRLKELGVKQESLFYYVGGEDGKHPIWTSFNKEISLFENKDFTYSAFTVAELGELLPEYHWSEKQSDGWCGCTRVETGKDKYIIHTQKTEADARGKMLIYLLENKLVTL